MKTKITELLGIEYPIVQGAMAWIAEHHLAAAVSKAGGLGIIAGGAAPVDYIREEIHKARAITDKPLGMNIMLLSPNADDLAQLAIDEKIEVLTTGAGNPGKYIADWKNAGIKVMPVVASVALAKRMERAGADAVIAEGMEGGGHIGELTTMPLVPQVVDALSIPVIAAGGIADGRGMAAAMMLGAEGVQCGTVFLASTNVISRINTRSSSSRLPTFRPLLPVVRPVIRCVRSRPRWRASASSSRSRTPMPPLKSLRRQPPVRCARPCRTATMRRAPLCPVRLRVCSRSCIRARRSSRA